MASLGSDDGSSSSDDQQEIKAVWLESPHEKMYAVILKPGQYRSDTYGQITLPDGFYSSGWMNRCWDCNWDELEKLPENEMPELVFSKKMS